MELGFWPWIPIVSGIPDSLSCIFLDSNTQDSGFHKQNILGLQIPEAKISRIPLRGVILIKSVEHCEVGSYSVVLINEL